LSSLLLQGLLRLTPTLPKKESEGEVRRIERFSLFSYLSLSFSSSLGKKQRNSGKK